MKVLAALVVMTGVAAGDPDPAATSAAQEANLESNAPREGVTLAASIGGGILLAKGSVDKIPVLSLRIGHVATPTTVLVLELTGGAFQHTPAMIGPTYTDTTSSVLVGAQYYVGPTFWIRGSGGLNVHTVQDTAGTTARPGPAGQFGLGVDLVVRHFWRLGLETYGIAAVDGDGLLFTTMLGLGLSHY